MVFVRYIHCNISDAWLITRVLFCKFTKIFSYVIYYNKNEMYKI